MAIEHSKDADMAAEVVLMEIIPAISKKLLPASPSWDTNPRVIVNLEDESESEDEGEILARHKLVKSMDVGSSSSSHYVHQEIVKSASSSSGPDLNVTVTSPQVKSPVAFINLEDESEDEGKRLVQYQPVEDTDVGSSSSLASSYSRPVQIIKAADSSCGLDLNVALNDSTLSNASELNDETSQFFGVNNDGNLTRDISSEIAQETSNGFWHETSEYFDQGRLVDVIVENLASSGVYHVLETEQINVTEEAASMTNNGNGTVNNLNEEWVDFVPTAEDYDATICNTSHGLEKSETTLIELGDSEVQTVSQVQGLPLNAQDLQTELNTNHSTIVGENSHAVDEIDENTTLSKYNPACSIDMLEETIDEAKTNKKTLFSSMESLINLMREVEHQEKLAEQANIAATTGGFDILDRVEEYQAMLVHAKEANDMHAGEIYGEKAILATELKELQSRLSSLSGERDESLAILDEMRQSLESRLAAADMLRKAAELEKIEKEESARAALLEQEAMMEKVVQESRRLQQEAEENSKLREFLMDRGQVVDTLQGEISVICQDIRLLKEKFDANLPLSKSFTASQTSCILASSGSSHKTVASNVGSEHSDSSEVLKITQAAPIVFNGGEEERSEEEHNALIDDGWDIFDKDAELDCGVF